jgi:predicted nucleic acid-binding protein
MRKVAIQDANILIDLVNIGLFPHCLALVYEFTTTELIFQSELNEVQKSAIQPHIDSGKFIIIKITVDELVEIQAASMEDRRLSEQDWSVIYYAAKQEALLMSGDRQLRRVAEAKSLEVRGIIWLFDQLVTDEIISKTEASAFMKALVSRNQRLPMEECNKRIALWDAK